ncbi:MAG TPA: hypothetical protein VMR18_00915 [Candidatus Saccharimonadales bacterium]|nr:hypothetical protein [Candidatus Saccharimonadales bacterium]
MATRNQIRPTFDQDKLVAALQAEINQGAEFVNIFPSVGSDKSYLVVTSVATHSVAGGMFSVKVKWSVPHKALDNAYYQRGTMGSMVMDKLFLEASGRREQFVFGLVDPGIAAKVPREIAANNAKVALGEIEQAKAYLERPASAVDPEVERFQRAMALAEAGPQPDTEPSDHWTEDDYKQLFHWTVERWKRKEYSEIWARRVGLSPSLEQRMAIDQLWFWVNALAALSGLELGQKGHPKLSVFAGYADQVVDNSNDGQRQAMEDIKRQFFG